MKQILKTDSIFMIKRIAIILMNEKHDRGNIMNNMIGVDNEYIEWLKNVKNRFKNTQIRAAIKVNTFGIWKPNYNIFCCQLIQN